MATLTSQIQALIAYANEATSKADTKLGDAVKSLADGYGGSGDGGSLPSDFTDAEALGSQLTALITYANSVTGQSDTTIGDAIRTLVDGQGGGGRLPSGYTECEYLESNCHQFIATDIYPNQNLNFEIDFNFTQFVNNETIFGVGYSAYLKIYTTGGNNISMRYGGKTKQFAEPCTNRHKWKIEDTKLYIDNVYTQAAWEGIAFSYNRYPIGIFYTYDNSGVPVNYAYAKLYSLNISGDKIDGTNTSHQFVPCLDNSNVPCLYDLVSRQPYYNIGTGSFGYKTLDGIIVEPT